MRRKNRRAGDLASEVKWVALLLDKVRRRRFRLFFNDPRLPLLALESGVFARHSELRQVCAFATHLHDAIRTLALSHVTAGDLSRAYDLLGGDVVWSAVAGFPSPAVRAELARHRAAPRPLLENLVADDDDRVRVALAQRPDLPDFMRSKFAFDPSETVRRALAASELVPVGAWPGLLTDESAAVRCIAAGNAPAGQAVKALLRDEVTEARVVLAKREDLQEPAYVALAADCQQRVRLHVAQNKATAEHALEALSTDHDPDVREAVSAHPNVSRTALRRLARDARLEVRLRSVKHRRCPPDALEGALEGIGGSDRQVAAAQRAVVSALASRSLLPRALVDRISSDRRAAWRARIAVHRGLPEDVAMALALDARSSVRASLARNLALPEAVLELLRKDPARRVTEALYYRQWYWARAKRSHQ